MLKDSTIWLMAVLIFTIFSGSSLIYAENITEEELGLRKENLYDEQSTIPVRGEPIQKEPGESTPIERAFENSPPLIPHDITGMLPLAQTENICLDCHMPDEAVSQGATPIPESHFVDLGTGEDLKGKLDGDRFNCMQCHVIQTAVTPAVANLFKGDFRDEKGKYRSNLLDILNEGVETD
ncbi:MAG: nitrate reductase cytochrome c-type subunit [Nitrospiraceae bacterium]|nr:MAG: nitrate reductase cytochrome c-type subunit [Nitrospiraceae bacterium]